MNLLNYIHNNRTTMPDNQSQIWIRQRYTALWLRIELWRKWYACSVSV